MHQLPLIVGVFGVKTFGLAILLLLVVGGFVGFMVMRNRRN